MGQPDLTGSSGRVGVYPGSFNPPTVAHLAIAEAARDACGLARVDLSVSRRALAKEHVDVPALDDRMAVLHAVAASRPWLGVVLTDLQLLADIAEGYDAVILGADKWVQLHDPAFYGGSAAARDIALARLPQVVIVSRPPHEPPPVPPGAVVLELPGEIGAASSTAVRQGDRLDWMLPEARAFDDETGAWTDPARYLRHRTGPT